MIHALDLDTLERPKDEAHRWFDFDALKAAARMAPAAAPDPAAWFLPVDGPRLVFVDGVFDPAASDPRTVFVGENKRVDSAVPVGIPTEGEGWALFLGPDHAGDPVQVVHLSTGRRNHVPARIGLVDDAVASVIETYAGPGGWTHRMTEIGLGRSARLMHSIRIVQDGGFVSLNHHAAVGQGASLVTVVLGAGDAGCRIEAQVTLAGPGAYAELSGALLARDTTGKEAALVLHHAEPGGTSRQVWRSVAADRATASVAARVEVARDAQKTDAEQSLKGLLLARTATINAKPELEIFADDVKCAHGATVGELDRNALFYLAQRGIPPVEAKALVTRAFVADAIGRIGDAAVRDAFMADADAWLGDGV